MVSFPYNKICTMLVNNLVAYITWGIADNTDQFRSMVSLLLRSTPELINLHQPLSIDFQLYFLIREDFVIIYIHVETSQTVK